MYLPRLSALFALATIFASSACADSPSPVIQGISQYVYNRIVHFLKIAQATYAADNCTIASVPRVATFYNATTDIYGWILHDDATKEIIVSFRGTNGDSAINLAYDQNWTLADAASIIPQCDGCEVHGGYYLAFLSIQDQVNPLLAQVRKAYPQYGVVVTGHR